MSTATYTTSGVTNPSSTHKFYTGICTNPPNFTTPIPTPTELSTAEYSNVSADDTNYATLTSGDSFVGIMGEFQLEASIVDTKAISAMYFAVIASGASYGGDGFNIYVKNIYTGAWVSASAMGAGGANTDTAYKGYHIHLDAYNLFKFIDSNNKFTFMVVNRGDAGGSAYTPTISLDYAYVELTYTDASTSTETTFILDSTYNHVYNGSIVISKPLHLVDGDIMFALLNRDSETNPNSVPSGWTLLASNKATNGWWLYYKIASSEGASWTWGFAGSSKSKGTVAVYRFGFNAASPIDSYSNTAYITSDTACRVAGFNVAAATENIIYAVGIYNTTVRTFTKPTALDNDWVEDLDYGHTDPDFSHTFGHCNWSSSGATGDIDITASTALTAKHAFGVALNNTVVSSGHFMTTNKGFW